MDILYLGLTAIACLLAFVGGCFARQAEPSQTYLDNRNWNASVIFDRSMSRAERLEFLDRIRALILAQDDSAQTKNTQDQRPENQANQPSEHAHG